MGLWRGDSGGDRNLGIRLREARHQVQGLVVEAGRSGPLSRTRRVKVEYPEEQLNGGMGIDRT